MTSEKHMLEPKPIILVELSTSNEETIDPLMEWNEFPVEIEEYVKGWDRKSSKLAKQKQKQRRWYDLFLLRKLFRKRRKSKESKDKE